MSKNTAIVNEMLHRANDINNDENLITASCIHISLQQYHDIQREADIQKVCKAVLDTPVTFFDNPNGAYENTCPFCTAEEYGLHVEIEDMVHDQDCAWLIAKDLMTNL